MTRLKDAYLDIVVLLVIILYAVYANNVVEVILWVYTGLLLLSKILAFFMPSLQRKANKTQAPVLLYHIIYALTVAILIFATKYIFAGVWGIIWIVSYIQTVTGSKKKKS